MNSNRGPTTEMQATDDFYVGRGSFPDAEAGEDLGQEFVVVVAASDGAKGVQGGSHAGRGEGDKVFRLAGKHVDDLFQLVARLAK